MMEDEDSIGQLTSSFCDPLMEDAVATNRMLLPLINDESIDNDLKCALWCAKIYFDLSIEIYREDFTDVI